MNIFEDILRRIDTGEIKTREDLQRQKVQLSKTYGLDHVPSNSEILNSGYANKNSVNLLRLKPTRTISGVAVVAAMTSPEICPHGRCIFCPGGMENNSPQAYTGYEPSALRGRMNNYDPFSITFGRLKQLETIGHDTSKVDLIVMGGTFTARPIEYQQAFIKGCLDGMNGRISESIDDSISINEKAARRCVGLTVETKPDWFLEKQIDLALDYGTTKVELGVQNLNEKILRMNNRGHGIREIVRSTQLSKDAALKIVYHVMPGMYGSSISDDKKSFDRMITCEAYKPDMLKIYPTLVVKGTSLYRLWKSGKYEPMDTEEAVDTIAYFLSRMPPWIRVQRMQRDIPVQFIEAGVKRSDIRNLIDLRLKEMGLVTNEIRSREVGSIFNENINLDMKRADYNASQGKEVFLSYETDEGYIAGFIRLRKPSRKAHRNDISDSGLVREIKVFGQAVPVGSNSEGKWQHRGIGRDLLSEAERITRDEFRLDRINVISGIGVREYFKKLGYSRNGPYMSKNL